MGSNAKKKTTFAKLAREHKLRERRIDKKARKDARKRDAELGLTPGGEAGVETMDGIGAEVGAEPVGEAGAESVSEVRAGDSD